MLSTFPSIDTAVDDIKFSQGLEKMAAVMDRGTLIRSYTAGDLGFILHSRHQFQWHTGYAPPQTVAAPHIGAVIARTLGPAQSRRAGVYQHRAALRRRRRRGIEGVSRPPVFSAANTGRSIFPTRTRRRKPSVRPADEPGALRGRGIGSTKSCWQQARSAQFGSDYQKESLLRSLDNAHRLLSSPRPKPSTSRWSRRRMSPNTCRRS